MSRHFMSQLRAAPTPPRPIARVIHHLDPRGRVLKIECSSDCSIEARRICVRATDNLMTRANKVILALRFMPARGFADEAIEHGYALALRDCFEMPQVEDLRHAITDLRPHLGVFSSDFADELQRSAG